MSGLKCVIPGYVIEALAGKSFVPSISFVLGPQVHDFVTHFHTACANRVTKCERCVFFFSCTG